MSSLPWVTLSDYHVEANSALNCFDQNVNHHWRIPMHHNCHSISNHSFWVLCNSILCCNLMLSKYIALIIYLLFNWFNPCTFICPRSHLVDHVSIDSTYCFKCQNSLSTHNVLCMLRHLGDLIQIIAGWFHLLHEALARFGLRRLYIVLKGFNGSISHRMLLWLFNKDFD